MDRRFTNSDDESDGMNQNYADLADQYYANENQGHWTMYQCNLAGVNSFGDTFHHRQNVQAFRVNVHEKQGEYGMEYMSCVFSVYFFVCQAHLDDGYNTCKNYRMRIVASLGMWFMILPV